MSALGAAFASVASDALTDGLSFLGGFAPVIVVLVALGIAMFVYSRLLG